MAKRKMVFQQNDKMVRGTEQSVPEPLVKSESARGTVRVRVLCNWVYGPQRFKPGQVAEIPEAEFNRFRDQFIFEEIK